MLHQRAHQPPRRPPLRRPHHRPRQPRRTTPALHDLAPLLAAYALQRVAASGTTMERELAQTAASLLAACASARSVPEDHVSAWLGEQHLTNPEEVVAALRPQLIALVPHDAWLFDRDQVGRA